MITFTMVKVLVCMVVAMSAKDWQDFADGLITDFGVEFGNGSANPKTYIIIEQEFGGTSPIDPPTVSTVKIEINAVFTNISRSLIDGTLIKQGDVNVVATHDDTVNQQLFDVNGDALLDVNGNFLFTTQPVMIEQNMVIERDGIQYFVVTLDPVSPYGTSIVKKFIARKK